MRKVFLGLAIAMLAWGPAYRASAEAEGDRVAAQQIADNMKRSGEMRDYRVAVRYEDGVAWLQGTVTSPEQKKTAERIAKQSRGVRKVMSKIEVADASGEAGQIVQPAGLQTVDEASLPAPLPQTPRMARREAAPQGVRRSNMPVPYARTMQGQVNQAGYGQYCPPGMGGGGMGGGMGPAPMSNVPAPTGQAVSYDNPQMPGYAWPSYAANPNYAALTYPKQYSPSAWPYIGPFYPYPQVPLGWRKVTLEWDDGWWMLDFKDQGGCCH
jgi:hypothetical protein